MNRRFFSARSGRPSAFIACTLLFAHAALASAQTSSPTWDMHELAPGVYASIVAPPSHPSFYSNSLVVVQDDHVVVVDTRGTPETARALLADIRQLTDKPVRWVINTHWHGDHHYGNQVFAEAFPDLEILAHPYTLQKLAADGDSLIAEDAATRAEAGLEPIRLTLPTDTVANLRILSDGSRDIRIIHPGPAHTSGDLVVHLPNEGLLALGDLIEQGFPYFGDGNVMGSAWALDRLSLIDVRRIVPAHARLQERTSLLDDQRTFLRAVVDAVRRGDEGSAAAEPFRNGFTSGEPRLDPRFDAFVADLEERAGQEADTTRTIVAACGAPPHRAFDFWIGTWEVKGPAGNVVGHSRIESAHGGCVIRENWTGATGSVGQSFNGYDRTRGVWHQTWVDNSGLVLQLDGNPIDNGMQLAGKTTGPDGTVTEQRITWTVESADGSQVRQRWESSTDGGETWAIAFDGLYHRKR